MERLRRFQLPNAFKKIGATIAILGLALLLVNKHYLGYLDELRIIFKSVMIIGLATVTLSKEKVEDELIRALRLTSIAYSFFLSILYTLIYPYIIYVFDYLIDGAATLERSKGMLTMLMMLLLQIMYFTFLKRMHNEK